MDDEDAEYMQGSDDEVRLLSCLPLARVLHQSAGLRV